MSEQAPAPIPESVNETPEASQEQLRAFNNLYTQVMKHTAAGGEVRQLNVGSEDWMPAHGIMVSDYQEGAGKLTAKTRKFALEGATEANGTDGGIMTTVVGEDGLHATDGVVASIDIWGNMLHDTDHTYVLRSDHTVDHWRSLGDADPDFDETIHKVSPISLHAEPELVGKLDVEEMEALIGKLEHSTPE